MEDKNDLASGSSQELLHKELVGRRQALSEIRDTAYKIIAAVAAAGITLFWLLLTERQLSVTQNIFLSAFVIILTCFVYFFLTSLHRGFQNNREIMVKLETCLGLYENHLILEDFKSTRVKRSDFLSMVKLFVLSIAFSVIFVSWCQYIFALSQICKDSICTRQQVSASTKFTISVNTKESKDFSMKIRCNDGGKD